MDGMSLNVVCKKHGLVFNNQMTEYLGLHFAISILHSYTSTYLKRSVWIQL